jgi:drug/metabolite transporter (DMT)-like permease
VWVGYLLIVVTALTWAGAWLTARAAAPDLSPITVTWGRFVVATLALLPVRAVLERGRPLRLSRANVLTLLAMSVTGIVAYNIVFISGVQHAPASDGAVITPGLMGPLAMIISGIAYRERPKRLEVLAAVLAALGVVLTGWGALRAAEGDAGRILGDGLFVAGALFWSTYTVLGRRLAGNVPAVSGILLASAMGVALLTPLMLLIDGVPDLAAWSPRAVGNVVYLGLFATATGFVTYYLAVRCLGVNRTMPGLGLVPFFGVLGAALLLGEKLGPLHAMGGTLVIAGIVTPALGRRKAAA